MQFSFVPHPGVHGYSQAQIDTSVHCTRSEGTVPSGQSPVARTGLNRTCPPFSMAAGGTGQSPTSVGQALWLVCPPGQSTGPLPPSAPPNPPPPPGLPPLATPPLAAPPLDVCPPSPCPSPPDAFGTEGSSPSMQETKTQGSAVNANTNLTPLRPPLLCSDVGIDGNLAIVQRVCRLGIGVHGSGEWSAHPAKSC